jgi:hypothetical protein
MNCEKISKPDLRDEAFGIRREITLKWRHYGREHTADALAHSFLLAQVSAVPNS